MISLTKRGRIITAIMAAWVVMIAIFATSIYFRPNLHILYIVNLTSSDVVIAEVRINGKRINSGDRILKPTILRNGKYEPNSLFEVNFKKAGDSVLVLDAKFDISKKTRLHCNLEDANRVGCIFFAGIRSENELSCFCDSYADFY